MIANRVPGLALALLRVLLPRSQREAVLGDVAEEYAMRARSGSPLPWLVSQICRSMPSLVWMAIGRGLLSTIAIAVGVWVAASAVEYAAVKALSPWIGDRGLVVGIFSALFAMFSMAGGGYVGARLRTGAATVMSAIAFVAVGTQILVGHASPLWYQLTFLLVVPVAPLLGGSLAGHGQLPPRS